MAPVREAQKRTAVRVERWRERAKLLSELGGWTWDDDWTDSPATESRQLVTRALTLLGLVTRHRSSSTCRLAGMTSSGELRVSRRGQMSLPASARHRWGLDGGGTTGYIDLGDAVLVVPGGIGQLRAALLGAVDDETWQEASTGFGDSDLASQ